MDGIMTPFEAESLITALKTFSVDAVGNPAWMKQHQDLERLNIQAHHNAMTRHDEPIVDLMASHDVLPILIHELLVIEAWNEKIFPLLVAKITEESTVKMYIIMYHEATICNILEVLLYHDNIFESNSTDEIFIELADYCYRKLTRLNAGFFKTHHENIDDTKAMLKESSDALLRKQYMDVEFIVSVAAVSIIRYISDHFKLLPGSLIAHMLDGQDIILSIVPLLEEPPWTRQREITVQGKKHWTTQKFFDNKWHDVEPHNRLQLTRTEGQIWLALYNLMLDERCRRRYEYNTHRKNIIIRTARFFTEVLFDQLPLLNELRRHVENLRVVNPPPPTSQSLAIVQVRNRHGCRFFLMLFSVF
jgi:hypothetical protein